MYKDCLKLENKQKEKISEYFNTLRLGNKIHYIFEGKSVILTPKSYSTFENYIRAIVVFSKFIKKDLTKITKQDIEKFMRIVDLEEIKEKQKELLLEAQIKSQQIQDTYQHDLQMKINQLNEEKAQKLADLEKTLNYEQETILRTAKDQIDSIEKDANQVCFVSVLCIPIFYISSCFF